MKVVKAILLIAILTAVILPVAAQEGNNTGGGNPIVDFIAGGINWAIQLFYQGLYGALQYIVGGLVKTLSSWLAYVPRPARLEEVKDAWKTCFDIYLTQLLPISLVLLGIYVMFSSEPPNRMLFEGYIKRVAYATLLAYFSFPIVDTLVWLTNQISDEILTLFVGSADIQNLANVLTGTFTAAVTTGALVLTLGEVLAPFLLLFILSALAIVAVRLVLIYLVAAAMPIFCFFLVIGVGPLRKLGEFVEYFWGLGIILPTLSVLGALIVGFMVKFANTDMINQAGLMGVFIILGPLFLVFAFPTIVSSMMGGFGAASAGLIRSLIFYGRPGIKAFAGVKGASAIAMGGKLAPLYAAMPSKLAVPLHRLGESVTGLAARAPVIGRAARAVQRFAPELKRDETLLSGAGALAKAGVPTASLGMLHSLAKTGDVDATNPHAANALEDISLGIGRLAADAASLGGRSEEGVKRLQDLRNAVSAVYGRGAGREFRSVEQAYHRMLQDNFEFAKKMKDPGVLGLASLLAAATGQDAAENAEKVQRLFQEHPELGQYVMKSDFARAFLKAQGVSERDLAGAVAGDYDAAWNVAESLRDVYAQIEPYNNTFRELVSGSNTDAVAQALVQDISETPAYRFDDAIRVYAEATGLSEARVREVFEEVNSGNVQAASDLAEHLVNARGRAIATLGDRIVADSLETPARGEGAAREADAARRMADFISAGGLVRTSIPAEEAEKIRRAQMYLAQQKVAQAKLREYIRDRMESYHRHLTHISPYTYDPEAHTLDYRAAMRGWSWVRGGGRGARFRPSFGPGSGSGFGSGPGAGLGGAGLGMAYEEDVSPEEFDEFGGM
ncbi:hypothetical protein Ferp_0591 [Ferroglobus placidus DSM 10642]|uniref:TrbL/VirB6 plasmid conjugal transfer protein n=2 Tax=Ferroglobus placidus TaxID=54261 RepID=D3S3D0_FERPA|nr:hypothetical protein Ferp_0591 [Ferroglobus placidus DSM 10642]